MRIVTRLLTIAVAATLAIAAFTFTTSTAEAQGKRTHVVKEGETLWHIAKQHGVSVKQLKRWNKIGGDALRPGTRLTLNASGKAPKPRASGGRASKAEPFELGFEVTDAFCASIKQPYKEELTRGYYRLGCKGAECAQRHAAIHEWRTKHYGYFKGFGKASMNTNSPSHYAKRTTFVGIPITVNENVIPALMCIEREVRKDCATCKEDPAYPNECKSKKFPYQPGALSGLRYRNTFRGGEVSNHVYGIAVDLDPASNTCCGCVGKWKKHPMCRKKLPAHERMIMPVCWVDVFESFGFYWLGRDKLQDTMHFEFLGDPAVVKTAVEKGRTP